MYSPAPTAEGTYPPYYGAATSYRSGYQMPGESPIQFPGTGGQAQFLGGLGQAAPAGAAGFGIASVLGAAVGGGLTGFLAAGTQRGAITGASFTSGLTASGNAFQFWSANQKGLALVFALGGITGIGVAIFRFQQKRR